MSGGSSPEVEAVPNRPVKAAVSSSGRLPIRLSKLFVPEAQYLQRQRPMCRLVPQQLAGQIKDAVNVVVVDVADHQHIHVQRLIRRERACGTDGGDARLELRSIDAPGAAIDHDQTGRVLRSGMQKEAVALRRTTQIHTEDHCSHSSNALERAQHVQHAMTLKGALATEVGGAVA